MKRGLKAPPPLEAPLNEVDARYKGLNEAWAHLENAAIELCRDAGFGAFGGVKAQALREALIALRKRRAQLGHAVLLHIAEAIDVGPESKAFVAEVRKAITEMKERIPR